MGPAELMNNLALNSNSDMTTLSVSSVMTETTGQITSQGLKG